MQFSIPKNLLYSLRSSEKPFMCFPPISLVLVLSFPLPLAPISSNPLFPDRPFPIFPFPAFFIAAFEAILHPPPLPPY